MEVNQMSAAVQEFQALERHFEAVFGRQENDALAGDDQLAGDAVVRLRWPEDFLRPHNVVIMPAGKPDGQPSRVDAQLGRQRRKDQALVSEAVRRGVRAAVNQAWGKKPVCSVLLTVI